MLEKAANKNTMASRSLVQWVIRKARLLRAREQLTHHHAKLQCQEISHTEHYTRRRFNFTLIAYDEANLKVRDHAQECSIHAHYYRIDGHIIH